MKIPNHYSPKLSDLDIKMVESVPPGGNWKNIPESIPSKRLENIRESFSQGKGSRSTYYGRLNPDMPSYTISTCINRPGNGCNIHYDYVGEQHRLISQREAARLQSFPDNFIFFGSKSQVNKQIGNAVPPLLSFQIAKIFKTSGHYIDLFSGAGGISLGFKWAGWKPVIANDIEEGFIKTYKSNIHTEAIHGDIRDAEIFEKIISKGLDIKNKFSTKPLMILGGPPCQGFSTAGNKRSKDDERNALYKIYCKIVDELQPDYFIFENVTGILNMEKGAIFKEVKSSLESVTGKISFWKINSAEYGIPQRRNRVFLIGSLKGEDIKPPKPSCKLANNFNSTQGKTISVKEALSDLPPLKSGEDGSNLNYICDPQNKYQQFMRNKISPEFFVQNLNE